MQNGQCSGRRAVFLDYLYVIYEASEADIPNSSHVASRHITYLPCGQRRASRRRRVGTKCLLLEIGSEKLSVKLSYSV